MSKNAAQKDIASQFLVEAVSLTGVVLGFGVSRALGLVFGLWPALKAARQNPIEALRYE